MATKVSVNCTTGLSEEVEMAGDELAAFEHQRANPPIVYVGQQTITARVTTTGATPAELFRRTLAQRTLYRAMVELSGVDGGNGNVRDIRASITAKRLTNGAILVPNAAAGVATVLADHRDAGAASWTVVPSVSGPDFVITVTGAANRTVDWFCRIQVDFFSPNGG